MAEVKYSTGTSTPCDFLNNNVIFQSYSYDLSKLNLSRQLTKLIKKPVAWANLGRQNIAPISLMLVKDFQLDCFTLN